MKIDQNRSQLEQAAAAILKKLAGASLPGITAVKVTALTAATSAYEGADSTQGSKKTLASGGRLSLDDLIDLINKGRRKILFAVEAAWSSDVAANAPIRAEFGLPPSRPFNG